RPLLVRPPGGLFSPLAGMCVGVFSGFAGIGGGILTNIIMTLTGLPMHKSIGRAAAAGIVVSLPATLTAALASDPVQAHQIGSIDVSMWACIARAQAVAGWFGARLAPYLSAERLSQILALALATTGAAMLRSSLF